MSMHCFAVGRCHAPGHAPLTRGTQGFPSRGPAQHSIPQLLWRARLLAPDAVRRPQATCLGRDCGRPIPLRCRLEGWEPVGLNGAAVTVGFAASISL
jgi:hypothetical protein